jgi:Dna[CI] antecedent, DciA
MADSFYKLGDFIRSFLDRHSDRLENAKLISAWQLIAGEKASKKSEAYAFKEGLLFVRVNDTMWSQELSMAKAVIAEKFRSHGYPVKEIAFRYGKLSADKKKDGGLYNHIDTLHPIYGVRSEFLSRE